MKIIPENMMNINRDMAKKQHYGKTTTQANSAVKSSDCDKITIASSGQNADISDAEFINQLKKTILSEVQTGASERKLDDLKQQIALNEYDINVPDMIRKIMLDN